MKGREFFVKAIVLLTCLFTLSLSTSWALPCNGDFNGDGDVDGSDACLFKWDFFRIDCTGTLASVPKTGQVTSYYPKDDGDLEEGVAGPNPRFTDNGDSTIVDNLTGLIWTKDNCGTEDMTWEAALEYIAGMNAGTNQNFNHTDWRLPNVRELQGLIDYERCDPALPLEHPFVNVASLYWSSTTFSGSPNIAWLVNLNFGLLDFDEKPSVGPYYVRAVCNRQ